MKLPDSYRRLLKAPLGLLIPDSDTTRARILQAIPQGSYVISVGDHTTEKMIRLGLVPSLQITDGLEKRHTRPHPDLADTSADNAPVTTTVFRVDNPPAEISQQSIAAIRNAFEVRPPVRIYVHGEEDLLVLPVCVYAPEDSVVLYGQPDEGLVVTPITDEVRNKTRRIFDAMGGT